jgi:hypothetical protein
MKKLIVFAALLCPALMFSQIGIKGGLNFANVTKADDLNNSSRTGFHAGIFLAPFSKGLISSRTELVFSRQGYNFKTGSKEGSVNLNYIMLPQLMGINITKYVQVQIGGQIAYLLNAKVDSGTTGSASGVYGEIMDYYNRFDYGLAGGVEIHPVKGLLIGARMNVSLGELYKTPEAGQQPSFFPKVDVKNNMLQVFVGWRFGKGNS